MQQLIHPQSFGDGFREGDEFVNDERTDPPKSRESVEAKFTFYQMCIKISAFLVFLIIIRINKEIYETTDSCFSTVLSVNSIIFK
jgi:hypothetical protein